MKLNKILSVNTFAIIFLKIILQIPIIQSQIKTCDTKILSRIGMKSFCESHNDLVISCFAAPFSVKQAYIRCQTGYYNKFNITEQTIFCGPEGKWSEDPMECIPICTENPGGIHLIKAEKLTFPTAYAEVITTVAIGGVLTGFPAIILDEKHVVIKCTNLRRFQKHPKVTERVHKPNGKVEYSGQYRNLYNDSSLENMYNTNDRLIFFVDDYIAFDENTKPFCRSSYNKLFDKSFIDFIFRYVLISKIDECLTPLNTENMDATTTTCLNYRSNELIAVECKKKKEIVLTYCSLGYENKNLDIDMEPKALSICVAGTWQFFGNSNDCEMVCGEIDEEYKSPVTPLIYKGVKIGIISAPWHVAIFANFTGLYQQICGGSIIHSNIIISTAHCFHNDAYDTLHSPSSFLVGAGKRYRNYEIVEINEQYASIRKIHIPQNFQANPLRHDIAVVILNRHLKYSSHIRPVCIQWESYQNYHVGDNINGHIAGWGATSKDDVSSSELLVANFTTITNRNCIKSVGPDYRSIITKEKFCAKSARNSSACKGDSGGGFVGKSTIYEEFRGRYILVGLISTGITVDEYCSDGFLTVFTNIQWYQDFINRAIFLSTWSLD